MAANRGRWNPPERVPPFIQSLFEEGNSLWMKILGGALATPLLLFITIKKSNRGPNPAMPMDGVTVWLVLVASCLGGAFLGAALSLKDTVRRRMLAGYPVPFPLKLMFGLGIWSALLWSLLVIGITLAVVVLTLGTHVL